MIVELLVFDGVLVFELVKEPVLEAEGVTEGVLVFELVKEPVFEGDCV